MLWITGARLVAAVSNAGGLGVIGPNAGSTTVTTDMAETGERLRREIQKVRTLTSKPFAVNVVLPPPAFPDLGKEFTDRTAQVAVEEKVPAVVITGEHMEPYIDQFKRAGITILCRGLSINVEIAKRAEAAGIDCMIAVGFEGGGHSGIDQLPTFVLVPQIVRALKIPVVAGGGIVDGRGMVAALALGAEGIFMGTRFMATTECDAHPNVKKAIIEAIDTSTVSCAGVMGMARGIRNNLTEKCLKVAAGGGSLIDVSMLYRGTIIPGLLEGDVINGSVGCGAAAGMITDIKGAADVVNDVVKEAERIISELKQNI
jgi:NAD(P)H-dependent flavin oxidoreductase YrpB (nitropropane dioxygenase family)